MVEALQLPLGSRCIKNLMFIFNLFFVITGLILIIIGGVVQTKFKEEVYRPFLDQKFYDLPILMIFTGIIILVIAFFGCCGAIKENYCMIATFAALMIIIFIMEFSGGIAGYVFRGEASNLIKSNMNSSIYQFNSNSTEIHRKAWDHMQREIHCCGINSYLDWKPVLNSTDLPTSCCPDLAPNVTCVPGPAYNTSCFGVMSNFVDDHNKQIAGAAIGIALIQVLGIWFSIYLARTIRNNYEVV